MNVRRIAAAAGVAAVLSGIIILYSATAETQDHPAPDEVRVIEVRSECPHPVWISYGRTEPLRAEDAITLGGDTSTFESMLEGDNVWLLDDERRFLGQGGVGPTTARVIIDDSCRRIRAQEEDA